MQGMVNLINAVPVVSQERAVFYRCGSRCTPSRLALAAPLSSCVMRRAAPCLALPAAVRGSASRASCVSSVPAGACGGSSTHHAGPRCSPRTGCHYSDDRAMSRVSAKPASSAIRRRSDLRSVLLDFSTSRVAVGCSWPDVDASLADTSV